MTGRERRLLYPDSNFHPRSRNCQETGFSFPMSILIVQSGEGLGLGPFHLLNGENNTFFSGSSEE